MAQVPDHNQNTVPIIEGDRWVGAQLRAHLVHADPHSGEPFWSYDLGEVLTRLSEAGQSRAILIFESSTYEISWAPVPTPHVQPKGPSHG